MSTAGDLKVVCRCFEAHYVDLRVVGVPVPWTLQHALVMERIATSLSGKDGQYRKYIIGRQILYGLQYDDTGHANHRPMSHTIRAPSDIGDLRISVMQVHQEISHLIVRERDVRGSLVTLCAS